MKIAEKLKAKRNTREGRPVTIAFLGDSVTQGCFECYVNENNSIETVFDYNSAFSTRIREILNLLYPQVQINIINSGISGDTSAMGLNRIERDILLFSPDLVVVSFGLNDSMYGLANLEKYTENIATIVSRFHRQGIEVIFLTQNFMCSAVSCHLAEQKLRDCAENARKVQTEGVLKLFQQSGARAAKAAGAVICDLYAVWERLAENGVDTTALLANKINHPIRELHYYMAIKIIEKFFDI